MIDPQCSYIEWGRLAWLLLLLHQQYVVTVYRNMMIITYPFNTHPETWWSLPIHSGHNTHPCLMKSHLLRSPGHTTVFNLSSRVADSSRQRCNPTTSRCLSCQPSVLLARRVGSLFLRPTAVWFNSSDVVFDEFDTWLSGGMVPIEEDLEDAGNHRRME